MQRRRRSRKYKHSQISKIADYNNMSGPQSVHEWVAGRSRSWYLGAGLSEGRSGLVLHSEGHLKG